MKRTQKQVLLEYLQKHRCITNREAAFTLGIMCGWKRIAELRADGHKIEVFTKKVKTRYGTGTEQVAWYWYRGKK